MSKKSRPWLLAGALAALAMGCDTGRQDRRAAYLEVLADVSSMREGRAVCVSTPRPSASPADEDVLAYLAQSGYRRLDTMSWPDTASVLVGLSSMRTDSTGMHTTATVFQTSPREDGGEYYLDFDVYVYRVECRDGCEIADRRNAGTGHGQVGPESVVDCGS